MVTRTIGVAIAIPEPWATQLVYARRNCGDHAADLVPPHVTLLPPTPVASQSESAIAEHLRIGAAMHKPFWLHLRGTGTFRPVTDVVFVAVASGISECELIQRSVCSGPLSVEPRFPYHPHVTIAHDVSVAAMDAVYEQMAGFDARFQVDHFTLYEHGADGQWRPTREFPLGVSRRAA